MRTILLFLSLLFVVSRSAAADPLNTYRFNRDNYFEQNGKVDKSPWFEWWYYKVIIPETNEAFYFTYGVVNPWDSAGTLIGTRATTEMGDFQSKKIYTQNSKVENFWASYYDTQVKVVSNWATEKQFSGVITEPDGARSSWNMQIDKKWSFNATSWATGKGITKIEWYPAQAAAICNGTINSHGKIYNVKNAPCYQDRNWGRSFPDWWTWVVSNNFKGHPEVALAAGGGRPEFKNGYEGVESVAVGFRYDGKEYGWRLNELDLVRIDVRFGKWEISAADARHKIEISAFAPKEKFLDLQFSTPSGRVFHDYEALQGHVRVKFYKRGLTGWKLLADLESDSAGIEYGSHNEYGLDGVFGGMRGLGTPTHPNN